MGLFGKSRTDKRVDSTLGKIKTGAQALDVVRNPDLKLVDKYLKSTQYNHLTDWTVGADPENCIPIRERKPIIIFPMSKLFTDRLSAKLLGNSVFPALTIEEDPDTQEFMNLMIKSTWFKSKMLQASKKYISHGSVFVRYRLVEGAFKIEHYNPNYCYPEFDGAGNLLKVDIKFVFEDFEDLDHNGKPKPKWFKLELNQQADILYDNPEFKAGAEPQFKVVEQADHGLDFVQGEWIRNIDIEKQVDGLSLVSEIFDFVDSFNYGLSQSDKAVSYGQEQQAWVKGLTEDEIDELVKSSSTAWNLGREGEAGFLEAGMSGFEAAHKLREELHQGMQQIIRVILLDPEKIAGNAQSAKAMEVLHGPMIEIIDEIRPNMEKGIVSLLQKMMASALIFHKRGEIVGISIPEEYAPISMNILTTWPAVFSPTMEDIGEAVRVASSAASANIIARSTATRFVAKFFDIEDIEAETQEINAQPQFGGFF